jgi:hypothetical protein
MSEIISCPSCQRKVQVPESLAGQDVQCPTCGATFVAQLPGAAQPSGSHAPDRWETTERPASWSQREPSREPHPAYGEPRDYRRGPDDYRGDYGGYRPRDLVPHRGGVILALGIVGLVVCPLTGPFAWVMGNTDMAEIRGGRMDPEGEGLTQAGRILGIISSVILLLYGCFFGLWFLIMISAAGGGRL